MSALESMDGMERRRTIRAVVRLAVDFIGIDVHKRES
jgi:hypothetical protein